MSDRPCTCHPDDNPPVPCPQKYALSECKDTSVVTTGDQIMKLADEWYAHGQTSHSGIEEKYAALRAAVEQIVRERDAHAKASAGNYDAFVSAANARDEAIALLRHACEIISVAIEDRVFNPPTIAECARLLAEIEGFLPVAGGETAQKMPEHPEK